MKVLKNKIIEVISQETGIRINPKELEVTAEDNNLSLNLWGKELLTSDFDDEEELQDDDFAEGIADQLLGEYYDLREKLIELKIAHLNDRYLSGLSEKLLDNLTRNKVEKRLLNILDFEFIDLGDSALDGSGFPVIALRITDFEDLEHLIKIEGDKDPAALDCDRITSEVLKKIRGKI